MRECILKPFPDQGQYHSVLQGSVPLLLAKFFQKKYKFLWKIITIDMIFELAAFYLYLDSNFILKSMYSKS